MGDIAGIFGNIANGWEFVVALVIVGAVTGVLVVRGPQLIRAWKSDETLTQAEQNNVALMIARQCEDCKKIDRIEARIEHLEQTVENGFQDLRDQIFKLAVKGA